MNSAPLESGRSRRADPRRAIWMEATDVVAVMTAVAVTAGVQDVASDDAQARLAVLLVGYVGLPLGGALWVGAGVLHMALPTPAL